MLNPAAARVGLWALGVAVALALIFTLTRRGRP